MTYFKFLIVFAAIGLTACITSTEESGRASPVVAVGIATAVSEAPSTEGSLAGTGLNPITCDGALARPVAGFTLDTRSATDSASADNSNIVSFCTASYMGAGQPGPFLTVGLTVLTSEAAAVSHFQLVKAGYDESGLTYNIAHSGARDLISAEIDAEGLGRIYAVREGAALVSIHSGPNLDDASLWSADVMLATANDLAARLNAEQ